MNLTWGYTDGARTTQTQGVKPGTTTPTTTTYTRAGTGHAITKAVAVTGATTTTNTYLYDLTGNTTQRSLTAGPQTLTWTATNRVATITTPTGTTSYHYTADGAQLIRRDPPGSTTIWLPDGTELTRTATTTTATRYYTHGATTTNVRTTTGLYRLTATRDGTTTIATNTATNTPTRRTLDPYGNPLSANTTPAWPDTHAFLDRPHNPTTGLTDIGARKYDPTLGTFLSPDPLLVPTDPISLGSYNYTNNNPTTFSDPTGLKQIDTREDGTAYELPMSGTNSNYPNSASVGEKQAKAYNATQGKVTSQKSSASKKYDNILDMDLSISPGAPGGPILADTDVNRPAWGSESSPWYGWFIPTDARSVAENISMAGHLRG